MVRQCVFYLYIFQLVRSSAESQVKYFPSCSFKGYTDVAAAIAAWDFAVSNDIIGVPKSIHSNMVPPTMPSHQGGNLTNPLPVVPPSTPSRRVQGAQRTPVRSTSSAPGSETRLAAIITALNDVDLVSHFVVVHGENPGVYSSRFVSFSSRLHHFLTFNTSMSACTALGTPKKKKKP